MRSLLFIIFPILLLIGCAKQTQPTGGPKDEDPPKLLATIPANRAVNFKQNEIELFFDELVQVNNPREQILITPSIGKKMETVVKKNRVLLRLNADLLPNTTYTISFREAIQDLNERNPAYNLKLAFSTGPYIDSLSISGKVSDLLVGKELENITVAAAPYTDTLDIFKHEASWITLSNKKGEFIIENLKEGTYLLYAFDDKNKNLIVDSKTELFAYLPQPLVITKSIDSVQLSLIKLDMRQFQIISAKPILTYFNVRLSKGFTNYSITNIKDSLQLISYPEDETTIRILNTIGSRDSLQVRFTAIDSIQSQVDSTFYLRFEGRSSSTEKFTAKIESVQHLTNKNTLQASLAFSKPVKSYNPDSLYIQTDSTTFIRFSPQEFTWDLYRMKVTINKTLPDTIDFLRVPQREALSTVTDPPDGSQRAMRKLDSKDRVLFNQLIAKQAAFLSFENDSSTTIQSPITVTKPENSAVLHVTVSGESRCIIQLLSKTNQVVAYSTEKKVRFDNLDPGDYRLRVIIDNNGNAKWDPGNFYLRTPPENIVFYLNESGQQTISLKANWEVGPLLIKI